MALNVPVQLWIDEELKELLHQAKEKSGISMQEIIRQGARTRAEDLIAKEGA